MQSATMQVKKLTATAVMPVRGSSHAAGFDLSAAEATIVKAGGKAIVKTGLSIAIPEGTYARLAPRSGLAAKKMIGVGAGVVDYDYRGEVGVVLFNHGLEDFAVEVGDRVAQLILESVCMADCMEVDSLAETARGVGGFGSTGVAKGVSSDAQAQTPSVPATVPAAATADVVAELRADLQVKKLTATAVMPVRGSSHAAGFDLSAAEATLVKAGSKAIVKTGLSIAIPEGTYARLAPRSGLAAKKMIGVGAGVVDYDYRGEVGVVLFNHGPEDFAVEVGDRVAQLILERVCMADCVEVETLAETARGAGGFGSTGVAELVPSDAQVQTPSVPGTVPPAATATADEVAELRADLKRLCEELAGVDVAGLLSEVKRLRGAALDSKVPALATSGA